MKAPSFAYEKPATLAEALQLLERPGARVLAGGQSLIPSLNMRLSAPELLVDITGISDLHGISFKNGTARIGALTTHSQIEKSREIRSHVPLLAEAAPHIAHAAIRNRGTLGGSLALADPAAEYPACAVALDAVLIVKSKTSERRISAEKFFKGLFETDLRPGEILTAVEFPIAGKSDRSVFLELTRRHGDYAIIGLAAYNQRFAFLGAGDRPVLFSFQKDLQQAKETLITGLNPTADLYNSSATKLHLASVLLERAWNTTTTSH